MSIAYILLYILCIHCTEILYIIIENTHSRIILYNVNSRNIKCIKYCKFYIIATLASGKCPMAEGKKQLLIRWG